MEPVQLEVEKTEYGSRVHIFQPIEGSQTYAHRINSDPPGQMRVTYCYEPNKMVSVADVVNAHLGGTSIGFEEGIYTKSGQTWIATNRNAKDPRAGPRLQRALDTLLTNTPTQQDLRR